MWQIIFTAIAKVDEEEILLDNTEYADIAAILWAWDDGALTNEQLREDLYSYLSEHGLYHEGDFVEDLLAELHVK